MEILVCSCSSDDLVAVWWLMTKQYRGLSSVRATCKVRGDRDSKESEQSIKTKYNSKKLDKQGGSSNNEIKE